MQKSLKFNQIVLGVSVSVSGFCFRFGKNFGKVSVSVSVSVSENFSVQGSVSVSVLKNPVPFVH